MSKRIPLHLWILIALVAGAVVGVIINTAWTPGTWASLGVQAPGDYLARKPNDVNSQASIGAEAARTISHATKFIGDLFIRLLRFVAVPVVLFSLLVGVASLGDVRKLGRIGGKTLLLFVVTTALAAVIGLTLSGAVRPGTFVPEAKRTELLAQFHAQAQTRIEAGEAVQKSLSLWDELMKIVPANPFAALAAADMLQVVFLSVALGVGLTLIPKEKSAAAIAVCDAFQEALSALIRLMMKAAPIAVFVLIAGTVASMGLDVLGALAAYCVVVIVSLAVAQFAMYPAFLWVFTPKNNKIGLTRFTRAMAPAQLLAFSSSSSNATLPVTMECTRDRLGVSEEITSFVCPLGATVNMAGTALYQAVAATFVAQLFGIQLELGQQALIVAMATLIAVGSPGVPGGSIVMMVIVLEAIHVPAAGIAVLLSVDRILDMCRTVVNISGDAAVAAMVAASERQLSTPEEVQRRAAA